MRTRTSAFVLAQFKFREETQGTESIRKLTCTFKDGHGPLKRMDSDK